MRRWSMQPREALICLGFSVATLSGCTDYVSDYERHVYDHEPIYCYRTIGDVHCHREPSARDQRQLVNYFGPAPERFPPPPAQEIRRDPPPPVFWFKRDPESVLTQPSLMREARIVPAQRVPPSTPAPPPTPKLVPPPVPLPPPTPAPAASPPPATPQRAPLQLGPPWDGSSIPRRGSPLILGASPGEAENPAQVVTEAETPITDTRIR